MTICWPQVFRNRIPEGRTITMIEPAKVRRYHVFVKEVLQPTLSQRVSEVLGYGAPEFNFVGMDGVAKAVDASDVVDLIYLIITFQL